MATIKDVAKRAGVSVGTISHALTGKRPVNEDTRRRILDAIKEVGYFPNAQAQALVTGLTQNIGMLFPYEYDGDSNEMGAAGLNTTQLEMIWEANLAVQARGYNLQLHTKENDADELRAICRNCDGLLVSMVRLHDERVSVLLEERKPFVMIGRPEEDATNAWVDTDFDDMVLQQISHLVHLGHRAIAFLDNESLIAKDLSYTVRSRQAYLRACNTFNLEPIVMTSGTSIEDGRRVMGQFLRKYPNLTALAAFNDVAAIGAYYTLLARGYDIPQDFSIITFTSSSLLRASVPNMTAMVNTGFLVSKTASELLIAQLSGEPVENNQVLIRSKMITGTTTGPVPIIRLKIANLKRLTLDLAKAGYSLMNATKLARTGRVLSLIVLLSALCGIFAQSPSGVRASAMSASGATLPYVELEAENAATSGVIIGSDRKFTHLAAEASGRKAVTLSSQGQFVEFTVTQPANSIVIRYSIPDSADGAGLTAPLSLYVNGVRQPDLSLTSKYGWFYGTYPFNNHPDQGRPHHFFDETHLLLGQMAAGSKVRLQKDATSTAASYTIDLADFEQVAAPLTQPTGSLSIMDYGADPTGAIDSTMAVQKAVNAGQSQGKVVWIPPGTFTVTSHILVDNVTMQGAGAWYSVLHGNGVGVYGNQGANSSRNVKLSNFAIFGEVKNRDDNANLDGIGGTLNDTTIQNLWIEHTKVGIWVNGPLTGLTISGVRIRNTTADGVNFHQGVSNSIVEQSMIRNTGDDGLAMWSEVQADHDSVFQFNTVQLPNLANNIAIYGGSDNSVIGNVVTDTLWQGGGIHVGNRFHSVGISGTTTITRNVLVRTGSYHTDAQFGVGAIWFYAADSAMTGNINITHNQIEDSSYEAIQFVGLKITNLVFDTNTINQTGTFGLQIQASGAATFNNVTGTGLQAAGIYKCDTVDFTITEGSGNAGWNTTPFCGPRPTPVYPAASATRIF